MRVILVPWVVLDFGRNPDGFIDLLQILLFRDFVAHREVRILRLGRTGIVAHVQARCRNYFAQGPATLLAALRSGLCDAVLRAIDGETRVARVFVDGHWISCLLSCFGKTSPSPCTQREGPLRVEFRACALRHRRPGDLGLRLHRLLLVDVPDAPGILTEHLATDLRRDFRIAVALDQLVGNLELTEGLDLPLRVAPQQRVGSPQHIVRTRSRSSVPSTWAHSSGRLVTVAANVEPTSQYRFLRCGLKPFSAASSL